jgi:hypothetical protein
LKKILKGEKEEAGKRWRMEKVGLASISRERWIAVWLCQWPIHLGLLVEMR